MTYYFKCKDLGWKGDIKITHLAIDKLLSTGWKSRYTSDESVDVAVQETIDQLKNKN